MNTINKKQEDLQDQQLRLEIVSISGFSLDEVDLVYQFVKGNNNALSELKEFRQWKKEKYKKDGDAILRPSQLKC